MRKKFFCILFSLFLACSLSGCNDFGTLRKQSLIKTYYQGPLQWAGITLGQSTSAEVREILVNLDETDTDTLWEGEVNSKSDSAICVGFYEGYRESGLCVWFVNGVAQFMDFGGGRMTLGEIQNTLGDLEKISVYKILRYQTEMIESEGISFQSGYIIFMTLERVKTRNIKIQEFEMIEENTVYLVYLINPDYINTYFGKDKENTFWNFFFAEGGFQDWNGYGEYEVKDSGF